MRSALAVVIVSFLGGCTPQPAARPLLAIPGDSVAGDFYDTPFPNDLRRKPDGTLDLSEFPTNSLSVESFRAAAEVLDGFGKNQPIFVRFTDGLDPGTLPDPATSMTADATVFLASLAPADAGKRTPVVATFYVDPTKTIGANHLVVRPYPGFPLDDGTQYALVITTRVHDIYGDPIDPADGWRTIIGGGGTGVTADARAIYQPLLDALDAGTLGVGRNEVAVATVFTTQHATAILPAIRLGVYGAPAPVATDVVAGTQMNAAWKEYVGSYIAPNLQVGDVPYRNTGGNIVVGADGAAVVQRMETMRFALTVPVTAPPTTGYPVVIYAHGTGGDYESYISDGTGTRLAQAGLAVISTDQVLHGPRNPGGDAEIDFFNFTNPLAARDNALQGAADAFSQHRLIASLAAAVPGAPKFDLSKVYFFGHSQGGATGPGFVAFEPDLAGAVMSGTGGLLTLGLLAKTEPLNVPELLTTLLRDDPINVDNPSIGLVQMWMERADPVNYAPLMVRHPVAGLAPRNIYQTEGFTDHYAPNPGIEAFATALGADIVNTPDHKDILGLTLRGEHTLPTPIANNAGAATAVLAQFDAPSGSDGHFVVFDVPLARDQAAEFLGSLARTGTATVVSQ